MIKIEQHFVGRRQPHEQASDPTPKQIRQRCREIQATWSDVECHNRGRWAYDLQVFSFPQCSEAELGLADDWGG